MTGINEESLDELVQGIQSSEKYKPISSDLVRALGRIELGKRRSLKEASKATRNKLHQVGSAFQEKPIPYAKLTDELQHLPTSLADPIALAYLKRSLAAHTSSLERLPVIERFFHETLAPIAPIHSILDLAGGLNALALPWMPVSHDITYTSYDIYQDMADFLSAFFQHFQIQGSAYVNDLTRYTPQNKVQVAFLLKAIPCLEQIDKTAGKRLLEELQAENILVSFPAHSLGGQSKGMTRNYETHFLTLVQGFNWKITRFQFSSELAFLIQK